MGKNILSHFEVIALNNKDYRDLIREVAALNSQGGVIYDALHLYCARKQKVDRVYTFNTADFQKLVPVVWHGKITTP